jgi:hypothetical protein
MIEHSVTVLMHGFSLFRAETAALPAAVLAWMWVMRIVLGASIVFLPRPGAVAAVGVMFTTAVSRFYIKGLYPDMPAAHIGASVHIVLWLPLAIFLLTTMRAPRKPDHTALDRAYRFWRIVALAVIGVSLVFDVREAIGFLA